MYEERIPDLFKKITVNFLKSMLESRQNCWYHGGSVVVEPTWRTTPLIQAGAAN